MTGDNRSRQAASDWGLRDRAPDSQRLQTHSPWCCLSAMKSAKSSSHEALASQKAVNAASPGPAKKRRATPSSTPIFHGIGRGNSAWSAGNGGGGGMSRGSSAINSGLPASAEKHWYGESPYPVGPSG